MQNKRLGIVFLITALFIGYMLGYSIPPFLHAGVFDDSRKVKGIEIKVDETIEKFYDDLYKNDEDEE